LGAILGLIVYLFTAKGIVSPIHKLTMAMAMHILVEMIRRIGALTDYLALNTPLDVDFRPSPNLELSIDDLGTRKTQIAYLKPAAYIEAHK
jgi:ABC-type phosphate/phosphonate transport system substrate-binding protein